MAQKLLGKLFLRIFLLKLKNGDTKKKVVLFIIVFSVELSLKEERILNYSFNDLDGIIFGINTSEDHKLEIMQIVHDVCQKEKRFDFNFYQASYNSFTGKIDIHPLNLIKITEKEMTV